jgi:transposase-like protein
MLSETAGHAELCRRYNIASGPLYTWKKQYADGKLDPEQWKDRLCRPRKKMDLHHIEPRPTGQHGSG